LQDKIENIVQEKNLDGYFYILLLRYSFRFQSMIKEILYFLGLDLHFVVHLLVLLICVMLKLD